MHEKKLNGKDWFCSWSNVLGIYLRESEKQLCVCVCKPYSGGPCSPKGLMQPLFFPNSFMALTAFIVKWVQVWAMLC